MILKIEHAVRIGFVADMKSIIAEIMANTELKTIIGDTFDINMNQFYIIKYFPGPFIQQIQLNGYLNHG